MDNRLHVAFGDCFAFGEASEQFKHSMPTPDLRELDQVASPNLHPRVGFGDVLANFLNASLGWDDGLDVDPAFAVSDVGVEWYALFAESFLGASRPFFT